MLGHVYESYVEGANDTTPDATYKAASRVMYYFASNVRDKLLSYIKDAKTPKDKWANLKRIFATSTTT